MPRQGVGTSREYQDRTEAFREVLFSSRFTAEPGVAQAVADGVNYPKGLLKFRV